jgi:hypothetical protein
MATQQQTTQAQPLAESTSVHTGSPYAIEFPLDPADDHSGVPDSYEDVIALDPDVLASLVIQLRTNLLSTQAELSHIKVEREDLITALAIAQTKISDLKFEKEDIRKAMADIKGLNEKESERAEVLQKELGEALDKVQERKTLSPCFVPKSRRVAAGSCAYNPSKTDELASSLLPHRCL